MRRMTPASAASAFGVSGGVAAMRSASDKVARMIARVPKAPKTAASKSSARATSSDPAIADFLERAWSELGLSPNTLSSYRGDLEDFARALASKSRPLTAATREDIYAHLATRGEQGYKARSN